MNLKYKNKYFAIGFNSGFSKFGYLPLQNYHRKVYAHQFELGHFWLQIFRKGYRE